MAYAETDELFRILKIRNPSDEQTAAAERILEMAAAEIDAEIDLAEDATISAAHLNILETVNLLAAADHWAEQEIQFGLVFTGDASLGGGAERIGRDVWERHALKLAPVKSQWGLA